MFIGELSVKRTLHESYITRGKRSVCRGNVLISIKKEKIDFFLFSY